MKPEELLDPTTLPDDLKWLVSQYRLQPNDPVFLVVAWHWNRIQACEDTVRAALAEMKAALDARIDKLANAAETVAGVNAALAGVQIALERKPGEFGREFEAAFGEPARRALAQLKVLEKSLTPLARVFQAARHREILAALLCGVALGVLSAVIVLVA
jgi:DNA-binding transcriptional regulator YbjK